MRLRACIDGVGQSRRVPGRNRAGWILPCVVIGVLTGFVWLGTSSGGAADPAPGAHAAHHPGAGAPGAALPGMPAAPSPSAGGAGMGGMEEMMKGMMSPSAPAASSPPPASAPGQPAPAESAISAPPASSAHPAMGAGGTANGGTGGGGMGAGGCCGGAGPKPFYPTLMTMPSLTPEARRYIEVESSKRLGTGSEQITAGQMQLHGALAMSDGAAVQTAVTSVRQGLFLVESGAVAQLAMNEGEPPPRIALTWFKGQSSVPVTAGPTSMDDGPWGLSWLHLLTMAFLVTFLAGALLIHFGRARRIAGLVERLGAAPGAAPKPPDKSGAAPVAAPAANPPGASGSGKPAPPPPGASRAAATPKKRWAGSLCVAAIFQETPVVKTFRLMDPARGDIPFTFLPGQFLTFSAEIHGKRIQRSYTISSSPTQRDYVEITVKREEQGAESRYLHDNVAVGDLLEVSGPGGVFTFTGKEAGSVVLIAGGVGITPMMCVTRYLTDGAYPGDIFFLYGARTTQDLIFREEIEYLQKRHANLHFVATLSHAEGDSWSGAKGRISKEFIADSVPDIARRRVHVCGPPPLMETVKAELEELGVPRDKIKTEAFGPALGAAVSPATASPAAEPAPPPDAPAAPGAPPAADSPPSAAPAPGAPAPPAAAPTAASAQATVQFSKSGKSGALAPDQSVLEAAEAIGVAIDFSCRVGTCGTCVVPLTSGTVTMAVEEGLPSDQKAKGIILACQAKSAGNLVVDA
jgi:ferredoxin-NADP reductase